MHTDTVPHSSVHTHKPINMNTTPNNVQYSHFLFIKLTQLIWSQFDLTFSVLKYRRSPAKFFGGILCYCFKRYEAEWVWSMLAIYPREQTHGKVETGPSKGQAIDWIAFQSVFLSLILYEENAGWCAAGCRWHVWPPQREERVGKEGERDTGTYPWQCFLFVEGVLGFDGRLSSTVGEECTTWNIQA